MKQGGDRGRLLCRRTFQVEWGQVKRREARGDLLCSNAFLGTEHNISLGACLWQPSAFLTRPAQISVRSKEILSATEKQRKIKYRSYKAQQKTDFGSVCPG